MYVCSIFWLECKLGTKLGGAQGVQAMYAAELLPLMSIVWHPVRPVMSGIDFGRFGRALKRFDRIGQKPLFPVVINRIWIQPPSVNPLWSRCARRGLERKSASRISLRIFSPQLANFESKTSLCFQWKRHLGSQHPSPNGKISLQLRVAMLTGRNKITSARFEGSSRHVMWFSLACSCFVCKAFLGDPTRSHHMLHASRWVSLTFSRLLEQRFRDKICRPLLSRPVLALNWYHFSLTLVGGEPWQVARCKKARAHTQTHTRMLREWPGESSSGLEGLIYFPCMLSAFCLPTIWVTSR